MQIQINTDNNVEGRAALNVHIQAVVEDSLSHCRTHVTRVEIHLSDENSHKTSEGDKRCVMEARLEGRNPVAVTHHADTVSQAVGGAAEKLRTSLDRVLARQRHH